MDKLIRILAFTGNALLLLVLALVFRDMHANEPQEYLVIFLLIVCPLFNLLALHFGPDIEERRLMRQVHKAELSRKLKELNEGR